MSDNFVWGMVLVQAVTTLVVAIVMIRVVRKYKQGDGKSPGSGRVKEKPIELVQLGPRVFHRQQISFKLHAGFMGMRPAYRYWCPRCSVQLADGPTGGCAVNAVCKLCNINYGNLDGFCGNPDSENKVLRELKPESQF